MIQEFYLKAVVTIETTRTNAQIRTRLAALRPDIDEWLQDKADGDTQTTLVNTEYRLKISEREPKEIYPKIVITVDSTRTKHQLIAGLDDYAALIKGLIRPIVRADPRTSILRWHIHTSVGTDRQVEP